MSAIFADDEPSAGAMALTAAEIDRSLVRAAAREIGFERVMPPFDPDQALTVVDAIEAGLSARDVAELAGYPGRQTISYWRQTVPTFDMACTMAERSRADELAAEVVTISDELSAHPACRSVRIAARKWLAARLNEKYRDSGSVSVGTVNVAVAGDVNITPADAYMRIIRGEAG